MKILFERQQQTEKRHTAKETARKKTARKKPRKRHPQKQSKKIKRSPKKEVSTEFTLILAKRPLPIRN